jgi:serine/threonine protein kinase
MIGKLVVVAGPEAGRTITLDDGATLTIGRGQVSDTRLNDPRISRVHCTLEVGPEGVILGDAGSSGGTFVGGRKITKHRLANGEEIQIGDSKLRFESDAAKVRPPAPGKSSAPKMSGKSLNDLVGQSLGHFKLDRILHTGGTSVLFQATDEQKSRPAVVKVMLPSITADEEQRSRFVRAVHTMINVRHDNLVEIYGAGKQGPFCWCAMEYVDGISILETIEMIGVEGRLDWREVYRVAVHVARALDYAHKQKVIHRNVTPENLLQRKHDKVVKLCDLMLAKALEGTQSRQVTAPGQLVGNVAYMSPERMVDTSNLNWRSDQYGLGATLFALLTGKPPFQAKSLPELVKAVRTEVPVFPEEFQQEANADFQALVLKMLSKDAADRFLFPSDLIRRLDEIGKENNVDGDIVFDR